MWIPIRSSVQPTKMKCVSYLKVWTRACDEKEQAWLVTARVSYIGDFRDTCIFPTPLTMFHCADHFGMEKDGCCHPKISKLLNCNHNLVGSIVLVHDNLEIILLENYILNFISIGLTERLVGIHITSNFLHDPPSCVYPFHEVIFILIFKLLLFYLKW